MGAVFLVGYYGSGNAGDELLLDTLVRRLRAHRPELEIWATAAGPDPLPAGVRPVPLYDAYAVTAAVGRASVVAMGGGGLVQDKGRADPWQMFHDPCFGVAAYVRPIVLGRWYGRRTLMVANGVGPIRTEAGRALVRAAALHLDTLSVRDRTSHAVLAEAGVEPDRVTLAADLVWIRAAPAGPVPGLAEPGGERFGVVNLRQTIAGLRPGLVRQVGRALDRAAAQLGLRWRFLPFHRRGRYGDLALLDALRDEMCSPLEPVDGEAGPLSVFEAFRGAQVSVGMRYHAAIGATLAGVPHVALSYDPKVEAVMSDLGVSHRCFDLGPDADALARAVEQAAAEGPALPERVERLRARAEAALEPLLAAVDAPAPNGSARDPGASPPDPDASPPDPDASPLDPDELAALSRNLQQAFDRYGQAPLPGVVRDLTKELGQTRARLEALERRLDQNPAGRAFRASEALLRRAKATLRGRGPS